MTIKINMYGSNLKVESVKSGLYKLHQGDNFMPISQDKRNQLMPIYINWRSKIMKRKLQRELFKIINKAITNGKIIIPTTSMKSKD